MSKTNLKALKAAMQEAKEQLISDIDAIDFSIAGVKPISDSPRCFTVSFSSIASNNFILSAEYYDVKAQKQHILDIVDSNKDVFATLEQLKAVNDKKKFKDGTPIHPEVAAALSSYLVSVNV